MKWHTCALWSCGQCTVVEPPWDVEAQKPCLNVNPPCTVQADIGHACTSVSFCIECGLAQYLFNTCSVKPTAQPIRCGLEVCSGNKGEIEIFSSASTLPHVVLADGKVLAWSGGWVSSHRAVLLKVWDLDQ